MKVTIYDAKPGPGVGQWFLKTSWRVGCALQKFFGAVDEYHGAESWDDAVAWLLTKQNITSLQYWGHGSPGIVWLAQKPMPYGALLPVKAALAPFALVWFRCCSVFQGRAGYAFAKTLADAMGCTVAGHSYIIGLWQSGLHTHRAGWHCGWSIDEGAEKLRCPRWPTYLRPWLPRTVFCLTTEVPKEW